MNAIGFEWEVKKGPRNIPAGGTGVGTVVRPLQKGQTGVTSGATNTDLAGPPSPPTQLLPTRGIPPAPLTPPSTADAVTSASNVDSHSNSWEEMFQRLLAYKNMHNGDTKVPTRYDQDPKLGRWVNTQRRAFKRKSMQIGLRGRV